MAKSSVQALGVRPRRARHSESGDSARRMRTATLADCVRVPYRTRNLTRPPNQ